MNQDAKQMREFCQQRLIELHDDRIFPADKMKIMIAMLDQIQMRLTLLEGASFQSTEEIPL